VDTDLLHRQGVEKWHDNKLYQCSEEEEIRFIISILDHGGNSNMTTTINKHIPVLSSLLNTGLCRTPVPSCFGCFAEFAIAHWDWRLVICRCGRLCRSSKSNIVIRKQCRAAENSQHMSTKNCCRDLIWDSVEHVENILQKYYHNLTADHIWRKYRLNDEMEA
jgi:hypothetical protein